MNIHPTAIIAPTAQLAEGVTVGPYSVIGDHVEIGKGTRIHSHVVIKGPCQIGENNRIFQFSSVGEDCQDKKYLGEKTWLIIGDNNCIREGCTIHRGTGLDRGVTQIGSHNLLMAYVHVGHDCVIMDRCVLANNVGLAGHVFIGDEAILGGYTTVHQFCQIGAYSMSGAHSAVFKDIPAYVTVAGNPARARSMNFEGMRRRRQPAEQIAALRRAYKLVYRRGLRLDDALSVLDQSLCQAVKRFVNSIKLSKRGITR